MMYGKAVALLLLFVGACLGFKYQGTLSVTPSNSQNDVGQDQLSLCGGVIQSHGYTWNFSAITPASKTEWDQFNYTYTFNVCGSGAFCKVGSVICQTTDWGDALSLGNAFNASKASFNGSSIIVRYDGGDICVRKRQPRTVFITYTCANVATTTLVSVTELPENCIYNAVVAVPFSACNPPSSTGTNTGGSTTGSVTTGSTTGGSTGCKSALKTNGYSWDLSSVYATGTFYDRGGMDYHYILQPCGLPDGNACGPRSMLCQTVQGETYSLGSPSNITGMNLQGSTISIFYAGGDICMSTQYARTVNITYTCANVDKIVFNSVAEVSMCTYVASLTVPLSVCNPPSSTTGGYTTGSTTGPVTTTGASTTSGENICHKKIGNWDFSIMPSVNQFYYYYSYYDFAACGLYYGRCANGAVMCQKIYGGATFQLGSANNAIIRRATVASVTVEYSNGDLCNRTQAPRTVLITYECSAQYNTTTIRSIDENTVCNYTAVIGVPLYVCNGGGSTTGGATTGGVSTTTTTGSTTGGGKGDFCTGAYVAPSGRQWTLGPLPELNTTAQLGKTNYTFDLTVCSSAGTSSCGADTVICQIAQNPFRDFSLGYRSQLSSVVELNSNTITASYVGENCVPFNVPRTLNITFLCGTSVERFYITELDKCIYQAYVGVPAALCQAATASTATTSSGTTTGPITTGGSTTGSACLPGTYVEQNNGVRQCIPCPPTFYSNSLNAPFCSACPAGTTTNAYGMTNCTLCNAGTESIDGYCKPCQPGTQSYYRSLICSPCLAGSYSPAGSSSCTPCPTGSFSNPASSSCSKCPSGTYNVQAGSEVCYPCPAGTKLTGISTCVKCPANTYSSKGSITCTPCPAGSYSIEGSFKCF